MSLTIFSIVFATIPLIQLSPHWVQIFAGTPFDNHNAAANVYGVCGCAIFPIAFAQKTSHSLPPFLVFKSSSHFSLLGRYARDNK